MSDRIHIGGLGRWLFGVGVVVVAVGIVGAVWLTAAPRGTVTATPSGPVPLGSRAKMAGIVPSGFWAVADSSLFTSTDAGSTWHEGKITLPGPDSLVGRTVSVIDELHAWSMIDQGTIDRTVDGGTAWQRSTLVMDCSRWVGIAFADDRHGAVVCTNPRFDTDTVLRTDDGGGTWAVRNASAATPEGWPGTAIAMTGASTIWASAISQDTSRQPLLAVSRDAGQTWGSARLPGIDPVYRGGSSTRLMGPPAFFGDEGVFTVGDGTHDPAAPARIFRTHDGGRTWVEAMAPPGAVGVSTVAVASSVDWMAPFGSPTGLAITADAGVHWRLTAAVGLPDPAEFRYLGFSDPLHGIAMVVSAFERDALPVLYTTSDGGQHWRLAGLRQ